MEEFKDNISGASLEGGIQTFIDENEITIFFSQTQAPH